MYVYATNSSKDRLATYVYTYVYFQLESHCKKPLHWGRLCHDWKSIVVPRVVNKVTNTVVYSAVFMNCGHLQMLSTAYNTLEAPWLRTCTVIVNTAMYVGLIMD